MTRCGLSSRWNREIGTCKDHEQEVQTDVTGSHLGEFEQGVEREDSRCFLGRDGRLKVFSDVLGKKDLM